MDFEEFVAARGRALLDLAYLLTGNQHDAEDLAQATLLRAMNRWALVENAENPDAYLKKICVNVHLNWLRRLSRREVPHSHLASEGAIADRSSDVDNRDELRKAMASLSPRSRTVVVLRYYEDLDDEAIARMVGVKPVTVRSIAHRALAKIRAEIDNQARTAVDNGRIE